MISLEMKATYYQVLTEWGGEPEGKVQGHFPSQEKHF